MANSNIKRTHEIRDRQLEKIIKENEEIEILYYSDNKIFRGKIIDKDSGYIYLCPYVYEEPFPKGGGKYINRMKIEEKYKLSLPRAGMISPIVLRKGYLKEFVTYNNSIEYLNIGDKKFANKIFNKKIYPLLETEVLKELEKVLKATLKKKDSD